MDIHPIIPNLMKIGSRLRYFFHVVFEAHGFNEIYKLSFAPQ